MYIKRLKIKNFRGIKELDWMMKKGMICIIGSGDSTKTTILDAIEYSLYPHWNLPISDFDFYKYDTDNDIIIETTIGDVPKELLTEETFGLYIRKFVTDEVSDDIPNNSEESFLTIRLKVNKFFEQEWKVITNRNMEKDISSQYRAKIGVGKIGETYYKDFNFGKKSVLNRYSENLNVLNKSILQEYRNIRNNVNLSFDNQVLSDIIGEIDIATKDYGISPKNGYDIKLDIKNSNIGFSDVEIYDGDIPVALNGNGTKRLMSTAMNIHSFNKNSIILIDEIEYGLEPYRLRQLIRNLNDFSKCGQAIFTSHSVVSVYECNCTNIYVCRSENGITRCIEIPSELQSTVRAVPEALLSKKVLITEGKTEFGILRALDRMWAKDNKNIEYYGTSLVDGNGGDSACKRAEELKTLGYEVSILIDSDSDTTLSNARKLIEKGIEVNYWSGNVCTEQLVFNDIPCKYIQEIIDLVVEDRGEDVIKEEIKKEFNVNTKNYDELRKHFTEEGIRIKFGKIANKNKWFKRIDKGENLGNVIVNSYNELNSQSDLVRVFNKVKDWVYGN